MNNPNEVIIKKPDFKIEGVFKWEDLKLDSNGKCPNGTIPTDANPRCK